MLALLKTIIVNKTAIFVFIIPRPRASAAANEKGALTHALNQALVCLARTLSARPVGACFKRCLASEITSFDSDSSRSRKLFRRLFRDRYFYGL
jgi:hypothetical protein